MTTIGLVCNLYNEANALPGWLETHLPYFDDVRILHAGPGGEYSNDGTIEILEKWKIPTEYCSIDEGFGVVRTKALRMCPCDWIMLLDADERFYPLHRTLTCVGEPTPHSEVDAILNTYDFRDLKKLAPNWDNVGRLGANLRVEVGAEYDQGKHLRDMIGMRVFDSIVTIRRHWHDFTFKRPTQNWHCDPDWQIRLVKNDTSIGFDPAVKMHERIYGVSRMFHADHRRGPFFDHFHFVFKHMEQEQRSHDVGIYDAIHNGTKPKTWQEFKEASQ